MGKGLRGSEVQSSVLFSGWRRICGQSIRVGAQGVDAEHRSKVNVEVCVELKLKCGGDAEIVVC